MTWTDHIKIHPAAEMLPGMSPAEAEALFVDIAAHGIIEPVVFLKKDDVPIEQIGTLDELELLDGRHRLDEAERAGLDVVVDGKIKVPYRTVTEVDPINFVVSTNLHRRHLTPEIRRDLIIAIKIAAPGKSVRAIAEQTGIPKSTVVDALSGVRDRTPEVITGRDGKKYTRPAAPPVPKKPAPTPSQARDQGIAQFGDFLHRDLFRALQDLAIILKDEAARMRQLPAANRIAVARQMLDALGVTATDLRGAP